jgi:hypothetical protein
VRKLQLIILVLIFFAFNIQAQQENCILKPPVFAIDFNSGDGDDLDNLVPYRYARVGHYCPSDGYYTYTPNTENCFRGDWFTLKEDHTAGDNNGNMLLINSSPRSGMFLSTPVNGLKGNTTYEFGVWMMNVCRITEKCPFPLLPDITIHLQTDDGKNVAQLSLGELTRVRSPQWKQFQFLFKTPASAKSLKLIMINHAPGGCGNDFVMDDITFRECIFPPPPVVKKKASTPARKDATVKPAVKKVTPAPVKKTPVPAAKKTSKPQVSPKPSNKPPAELKTTSPKTNPPITVTPPVRQRTFNFPPPPEVLKTRTNALIKRITIPAGEIKIDLYDNGEIDDDTVTIYHNNRLLVSRARLSQKPITFRIAVNDAQPHHEFIMVANNLGSIPPNTSLMIVTAGETRHEVFISSTRQKNAKVVLDLAE